MYKMSELQRPVIAYSILPEESQKIMSKQELASVMCFLRNERFVEGYSIDEDLFKKIAVFFGKLGMTFNIINANTYHLGVACSNKLIFITKSASFCCTSGRVIFWVKV